MENLTPYADASTYNNFYEFGTDKSDPARTSGTLKTTPWSIEIEGLVKRSKKVDMAELLKIATA